MNTDYGGYGGGGAPHAGMLGGGQQSQMVRWRAASPYTTVKGPKPQL